MYLYLNDESLKKKNNEIWVEISAILKKISIFKTLKRNKNFLLFIISYALLDSENILILFVVPLKSWIIKIFYCWEKCFRSRGTNKLLDTLIFSYYSTKLFIFLE